MGLLYFLKHPFQYRYQITFRDHDSATKLIATDRLLVNEPIWLMVN